MKLPTAESAHRNYGIDRLRVLCMFYIVLIHNLGYGGVVAAADWVRQQLFRLLRVKSRVHRLADRLFRAKVNDKNCFRRFSGVKKKRRTL